MKSTVNEIWVNLFTSVSVSEKTVDEIKKKHDKLPKLKNNQVRLIFQAIPFNIDVFEAFARGESIFVEPYEPWIKIQLRQIDLSGLKVQSSYKWTKGICKLRLSAIAASTNSPERQNLWTIIENQTDNATRLGYSNAEELIQDVFSTDLRSGDNREFEITLTNPASIEKACFNGSSFDIEIKKSDGVIDLQLNLVLKRSKNGGSYYPVFRKTVPLDKSVQQTIGNIVVQKESVFLEDVLPFDRMEVAVIHRNSALTLDQNNVEAPFQNAVEPFLKTLSFFCALDDFKKMLLNPQNYGKQQRKYLKML